jgi:O-acetylserine/cysteine efflux transporter
MRPSHVILACLASVIWGLAFVFTKFGLDSFSAPQLTALRFLVACPLVFFLPRPAVSWSFLAAIGLTLFAGQLPAWRWPLRDLA